MPAHPGANSRSNRGTFKRYEEAAELQEGPDGKLWPQFEDGVRYMPVAVHLQAEARMHEKLDKRANRFRGERIHLERVVERLIFKRDRTQAYILAMKERLQEAADAGLTVAEFLEKDRAAAVAYFRKQATHTREWKRECFLIARPLFKSGERVDTWLRRPIPALFGKTPLEYAGENGHQALREFVQQVAAAGEFVG